MTLPINLCKKLICCAALLMACLVTSGCWDRREIQDRSFVLALAIDKAEAKNPGQSAGKKPLTDLDPQIYGGNNYQLSLQVLKLTPSRGSESGSQSGGTKTYVLSASGPSLFEMLRDMGARNSKALWFEHMQVMFISDQVIREASIDRIIDLIRRDAEMRWSTRIYITSGSAKSLLEYEPPTGEPGGLYFTGSARNVAKNPHLATAGVNLAYLARAIDNQSDFILPRIEMEGKEVKIAGMAMFRKDRFIGYVSDYTVKGVKLLRGLEKSALITTECPDHPGEAITYELFRHDTILEPHIDNDTIYFTVNIAMRGNIGEGTCSRLHKSDDPEFMARVKAALAREVERNIQHAVAECQRLGVDDLSFAQYLKAYKPKDWAKVKDRWDEVFPTIPVYVTVRLSIMNLGEHR